MLLPGYSRFDNDERLAWIKAATAKSARTYSQPRIGPVCLFQPVWGQYEHARRGGFTPLFSWRSPGTETALPRKVALAPPPSAGVAPRLESVSSSTDTLLLNQVNAGRARFTPALPQPFILQGAYNGYRWWWRKQGRTAFKGRNVDIAPSSSWCTVRTMLGHQQDARFLPVLLSPCAPFWYKRGRRWCPAVHHGRFEPHQRSPPACRAVLAISSDSGFVDNLGSVVVGLFFRIGLKSLDWRDGAFTFLLELLPYRQSSMQKWWPHIRIGILFIEKASEEYYCLCILKANAWVLFLSQNWRFYSPKYWNHHSKGLIICIT